MTSLEYALNYLLDNFVLVNKQDVEGISGYFCNRCMSFEIKYITNLERSKGAGATHMHVPPSIDGVHLTEIEAREEAYRLLIAATNSLLTGQRFLEAFSHLEKSRIYGYKGPLIRLDSLTSGHWAEPAIGSGHDPIDDRKSNNLIKQFWGTYVLIYVQEGEYSGYHLVRITTYPVEENPSNV
jgi:hypothetical protein